MAQKDITFPCGRLIGGSVTKGDSTDSKGQPRLVKTGPNAGQPFTQWSFGVAYPKGAEQSWAQTEWGAKMYAVGLEGYPNGETQRPDFSWKVTDGDSQIPNKKGKRPCDQQGYPGHWIIWYSSGAAPKQYDIIGNKLGDAPRPLAAGMEIVPGYYVQVFGSAKDNKPSETPGIYMNHSMVALVGYGERISQGPDVNEVGFGGVALPPGAATVPVAGAGALPGMPPAAAAPLPTAAPLPGVPVQVAPNPAILAAAPPPPAAAIVAPPPPAPGIVMIGAYTYDQLKAANYSDDQMIAQGYAKRA